MIMQIDDLPEDMKDAFTNLKHGSATIEAEVMDALETTNSLEDFGDRVDDLMTNLIQEAQGARAIFSANGEIVLDAVKFLEWINGAKRMNVGFKDLRGFKTLWDIPDLVLPSCVFVSGFDVACKRLSNDTNIVRIADEAARCMGVKWKNIPEDSETIDNKSTGLTEEFRKAHGNVA
jgi:hypothetical protein